MPRSFPLRAAIAFAGLVLSGCPSPTPATPTATRPPAISRPPPAAGASPIVDMASRDLHTCAVRQSGDAMCWGKNTYGQLGNGSRVDSGRTVKVQHLAPATQVSVGRDFSCALLTSATVACWGNNQDGQLGDGRGARPGAISLVPVSVAGLRDIAQVSAGDYHACARDRTGSIWCWGNAEDGQLGSDSARAFAKPVRIADLGDIVQLASGGAHVCALDRTGLVHCWGRNAEGQLGIGARGSRIQVKRVAALEDVVEIASGSNHTCARKRSGELACWGSNAGQQLGVATYDPRQRQPIAGPSLHGILRLAAGAAHTCALLQAGRVLCWGANDHGQLGRRLAERSRAEPVEVPNLTRASALALGTKHTCAALGGSFVCWGANDHFSLGSRTL